MPYGFFITDTGRQLIDKAITENTKVDITTACFGSGGSPDTEPNYAITELVNSFYEKQMNPDTDDYRVDENDPYSIYIQSELPNEVTGTVNEIGYKDSQGNLVIYGIVRERVKEVGTKGGKILLQYRNWIKLENGDLDSIEIKIKSAEYEKVEQLVNETRTEFTQTLERTKQELTEKLEESSNTMNDILERAENDFNLDNYVQKNTCQEVDKEDVERIFEMAGGGSPGEYPSDWVEASDDDIRALFN